MVAVSTESCCPVGSYGSKAHQKMPTSCCVMSSVIRKAEPLHTMDIKNDLVTGKDTCEDHYSRASRTWTR